MKKKNKKNTKYCKIFIKEICVSSDKLYKVLDEFSKYLEMTFKMTLLFWSY